MVLHDQKKKKKRKDFHHLTVMIELATYLYETENIIDRSTVRAFTYVLVYGSSWNMFSEHTISCSLNGF